MTNYYFFIDECGDQGLSGINQEFPVFVVCGILISESNYDLVKKRMESLKERIWENKKVIFHSRDIRKCDKEFSVLFDLELKKSFYEELNQIISEGSFIVFASAIDKNDYIKKYGRLATDVYEIALSFIMERAVFCLDDFDDPKTVNVVVEKRGRREDENLQNHFQRILSRGTGYVHPRRFQDYNMGISFAHKNDDVIGLQLSDLAAYPIARHVLDAERANPAYDIIKEKLYSKGGKLYGLKKFP